GENLSPDAAFTWATFGVCLRSVVEEFKPNERIAWRAQSLGVDAYHAWVIEPTSGGCRVKTEEAQYGWLAVAANWLMPDLVHRGHRLGLECLRTKVAECRGR